MNNSKQFWSLLCFLLLGSSIAFAQTKENPVQLSLRLTPSVSNAYYSGSLIAQELNNDHFGLSSNLGIGLDVKLTKRVYLITGLEYVSLTEVTLKQESTIVNSQIIDTVFTVPAVMAKNRLNYVTIPIGIKLMLSDQDNMDFYIASSISGMYRLNGKHISTLGSEVTKATIENSEGIADWVWGGRIGVGIEVPINFTSGAKLFIEPNIACFPQTNKPNGNLDNVGAINRMMYAGGVTVGLKL